MGKETLRLISISDIQAEEAKWLWYPYLPRGKITIVQGDPGEKNDLCPFAGGAAHNWATPAGKRFGAAAHECHLPDGGGRAGGHHQTKAYDGWCGLFKGDGYRRKPEGTEPSRRAFKAAAKETGTGLIVLDPLQAYLGDGVDMHRANEVRPVFKKLCAMAERTSCAEVLIGHMNKMQGAKFSYRGLGSLNFQAAARRVLLVGRLRDEPNIRVAAHDKSSLAPEGWSIAFELNRETGFQWKGYCDTTVDELLSGAGCTQTKTTQMEEKPHRWRMG